MTDKAAPLAVLVVGGDDSTERLLLRILRTDDHDVVCTPDRKAALSAIAKRAPTLIVLIAKPDDLDWLELCRELRAREPTRSTAIMVLSGINSLDARVAAAKAGADEFVPRPFTSAGLRARVASIVKLKRAAAGNTRLRRTSPRSPETG